MRCIVGVLNFFFETMKFKLSFIDSPLIVIILSIYARGYHKLKCLRTAYWFRMIQEQVIIRKKYFLVTYAFKREVTFFPLF